MKQANWKRLLATCCVTAIAFIGSGNATVTPTGHGKSLPPITPAELEKIVEALDSAIDSGGFYPSGVDYSTIRTAGESCHEE